jgi:hypothetical protein
MQWQPSLSTRLAALPNVLAGPVLRKVTADSVTVWFALKRKATVTLTITDTTGTRYFSGKRDTVAVGANLHIVAVTAQRDVDASEFPLSDDTIYWYDATFAYPASNTVALPKLPAATESSIAQATRNVRLTYAQYPKPSFCMPASDINSLRILHGSCRKAAGDGPDMLALVDTLIAEKATVPLQRPQQLLLTGDQIYADDVAPTLLIMLTDAATVLLGWDEILPTELPAFASMLPPFSRRAFLTRAGFTSEDLDSHLMSLGEYLCMYLFVWSDVLWPDKDTDIPNVGTVLLVSDAFVPKVDPNSGTADKAAQARLKHIIDSSTSDSKSLLTLRASVSAVRCALANVATYMVFDDHEVTDDWNMTYDIAVKLYGTDIGRRVVQNALVAYALCQHWGNAPEQFEGPSPEAGGPGLLFFLDGRSGAEYISNSPTIAGIVGVPTLDELKLDSRVSHHVGSLTYNYTIEGRAHQVIVTDTRTYRSFPEGGGEAPELLPTTQFAAQIVNTPALRQNAIDRALIVVLSTNVPPVQPIRSATEHDWIANHFAHYPDIHEAWDIPSRALDRLMKALSDKMPFDPARSAKVVVLSGDVHIGFASRLHYRATKRFEDSDSTHANVVVAQLVASSFKKQTDDTIGLQREGYTYAPHWYAHPLIADHETEYYVGWNVQPTGQSMGVWEGRWLTLDRASSVYLKPHKRAPGGGKVDTPPSFLHQPPDFGYQLDYLNMTSGGIAPTGLRALPPLPPAGATDDERKESAHLYKLATDNYRQYNRDSGVVRHLIGVNNFGDLSFTYPKDGTTWKVNHRLRFRDTAGRSLFVDYAINMETVDPDHPTNAATGQQVTP